MTQPCVIDPTRAPEGRHTLWAYCHVPNGSGVDMREKIESQIERFAPGFRDRILAHVTTTAADAELHNPSYVGGDIGAGAARCGKRSSGPPRGGTPIGPESRASTSARRPRPRVEGCMACAVTVRHAPHCTTWSDPRLESPHRVSTR